MGTVIVKNTRILPAPSILAAPSNQTATVPARKTGVVTVADARNDEYGLLQGLVPVLEASTTPEQPRPGVVVRQKSRYPIVVAVVAIGLVVAFIKFAPRIAIAPGFREGPEEPRTDKVRRQQLEALLAESFDGSCAASSVDPSPNKKKEWQR